MLRYAYLKDSDTLQREAEEKAKNLNDFSGVHRIPQKKVRLSTLGYTKGVKTERMKILWKKGYSPKSKMLKKTKRGSLIFFYFKGKLEVGMVIAFHKEKFTIKMAKTKRLYAVPYNLYNKTISI